MLPNNGILLNKVSRPKLLNNPFASCSFTKLDLLFDLLCYILMIALFYHYLVLKLLDLCFPFFLSIQTKWQHVL